MLLKNGVLPKPWSERLFLLMVYAVIAAAAILCFLPFWMIIVDSFATEGSLQKHGFQLLPKEYSLYAYQYLLEGKQIFLSYRVSLTVTAVGTLLAVLVSSMYAYVLAHRKVKYRNILSFLTYFTMIFGAGLVGFYLLVANWLGLKDSIWALILPYLLNPFYTFVLVSFFRTLPFEINEAATVDGAGDVYLFFRIIVPLSVPIIATVSLFYAVQYWNDWWLALLFIDDYKLHPLQLMIRQLISNANIQSYVAGGQTSYATAVPSYGIQLATVCLTIGPIILLYPLLQRYYIQGITVGAVKG